MRHIGEEFALGLVGRFGGGKGLLEILFGLLAHRYLAFEHSGYFLQ